MTDLGQALGRSPARPRSDLRHLLTRYGFFVLLAAVLVVFALLRPTFANEANLNETMRSAAIAGLMFLGLTWIIAAGEIDLSFMSVAALANMVVAVLVRDGTGWALAGLAGLGAGLLFGALNAGLVAVLRLPSLVITIATGALAASIAAALGLGTSISLSQTGFVGRILVLLYLLSAGLSALAGILLAAALSSGQPYLGNSYFLDRLTAVLLGGMALKLGKPNVIGTLAGIVLLIGLLNGAALLGWTDSQRQIVRGSLLLLGVGLVVAARRRGRI